MFNLYLNYLGQVVGPEPVNDNAPALNIFIGTPSPMSCPICGDMTAGNRCFHCNLTFDLGHHPTDAELRELHTQCTRALREAHPNGETYTQHALERYITLSEMLKEQRKLIKEMEREVSAASRSIYSAPAIRAKPVIVFPYEGSTIMILMVDQDGEGQHKYYRASTI